MKLLKINHLDLIIALYIFGVIVAALMGMKVMPLGEIGWLKFNVSVAIILMPLMFTLTDAVNEIYGRQRARQMIYLGVIVQVLLVLFIWAALAMPHAARFEFMNDAYSQVFGISVRFALASITAFTVSGLLDVYVFSKMKKLFKGKYLWLRNNVSNFISMLFDTAIFLTIAHYGVFTQGFENNVVWLIGVIIPYWIAKCIMSVISTPLVYAGVAFLRKRKENPKELKESAGPKETEKTEK
ncbi:queuosine precursor transporter [Candidatus Saccharibacteria bacterium]|nr:queuosine precursor transporter [Candidatus Saccharibacteria bacterium]